MKEREIKERMKARKEAMKFLESFQQEAKLSGNEKGEFQEIGVWN